MNLSLLTAENPLWPRQLSDRLGSAAPPGLQTLGSVSLLAAPCTALFCSTTAPGAAILRAHDTAQRLRDEGTTVISGFHSPLEQQCLQILLRGRQPIIIGLARTINSGRILPEYRDAFEAGRILFLAASDAPLRITRESAIRRNGIVAALAQNVYFAHITPGGHTAGLAALTDRWQIPRLPTDT